MRLNHSRKDRRFVAVALSGILLAVCLTHVLAGERWAAGSEEQSGAATYIGGLLERIFQRSSPAPPSLIAPPTFDPATDLVIFPNEKVAFIIGPQLRVGSRRNPFPWFDQVQLANGLIHGERFPATPPLTLSGTLSLQQGSRTVSGSATRFTREVDPAGPAPLFNGRLRIRDASGTWRALQVTSVQSDSQLTLSVAWSYPSVTGAAADTYDYDPAQTGWNYDNYHNSGYYDLALVEYINYYRTGDSRYLELARKVADSWWSSDYIRHGTVTGGGNNLPPRSMAYAGLMLRAMDGRPEMWDYLQRQVRAAFDSWVRLRRDHPSYYGDPREGGYSQLYAVMLARVLPESYPLYANGTEQPSTGVATDGATKRAAYLLQAEDAAVNYFGRLQRADGSWRWDVGGMNLVGIEQPFLVGLYLESAVLLHQLSQNASVRASLANQLTQACRHLYRDGYRGQEMAADMPQYRWRGMWYFWGGGTTSDPTLYARQPDGERLTNGDAGMIRQVRHLNSTVHHAYGYAYAVTGDEELRRMGDEIFGASYGDGIDQVRGLADSPKAKDYAMNYRASGRYLVWRLSGSAAPGQRTVSSGAAQTMNAAQPATATAPPELIASALALTMSLARSSSLSEAQVREVLERIEAAQRAFAAERGQYISPESVLEELRAALQHARTALRAAQAGPASYETAKIRLEWAAARLKRANERVSRR